MSNWLFLVAANVVLALVNVYCATPLNYAAAGAAAMAVVAILIMRFGR